jgi:hypothetical protein
MLPLSISVVSGQTVATTPPASRRLAFLIPGALESAIQGLPPSLQAVARPAALSRLSLASFNSGVAAELSNLPSSSSASALRYVFDPAAGAYVPTAQSLGPVLTERAETIGKDRLFLEVTHQRFQSIIRTMST